MDLQQPESTTEHAPGPSEIAGGLALDLIGGPFAVIESDPGEFEVIPA
jgi:hypothetical protein